MTQLAFQEQIEKQINALKVATDEAVQSKETAIKYLSDAGIISDKEKRELEKKIDKK